MENLEEIKQKYKEKIYRENDKHLFTFTGIGALGLLYFAFNDILVRENIYAFYTRLFPLLIIFFLLISGFFTKGRWLRFKLEVFNISLISLLVMMYSKYIVYLNSESGVNSVTGIIAVIFILSLLLKAQLLYVLLAYLVPTTTFLGILYLKYDVSSEISVKISNIYPMIIAAVLANRIYYRLDFNVFKSNQLLAKEKERTEEFYQEAIAMNDELHQKNEEITVQRDEIADQKVKIEKQHKHIKDSIMYAKRIQEAMLPSYDIFAKNFKDFFIIYIPRDIVSGDFYWAEKYNNTIIYAVADCTGHGVPGAMVSMLGISHLNRITSQTSHYKASDILERLRIDMKKSLKQNEESENTAKDGMDIALCVIDLQKKQLQFSGAYNSLYIYRDDELIKLKADKQPIAVHIKEREFTNQEITLQDNDILYSFSDGFVDQFNEEEEKYKIRRFTRLLQNNALRSMHEQKHILENEFISWKKNYEQIDDVVIAGIKI